MTPVTKGCWFFSLIFLGRTKWCTVFSQSPRDRGGNYHTKDCTVLSHKHGKFCLNLFIALKFQPKDLDHSFCGISDLFFLVWNAKKKTPHPNKKLDSPRWPYTTKAFLGHFGRIGFHYLLRLVKFCWGVEELHRLISVEVGCLSSFHGFSKLILKDHKVRIDVGKSRKWFQDCYVFHAMIYHDLSETLGSRRLVMIKNKKQTKNEHLHICCWSNLREWRVSEGMQLDIFCWTFLYLFSKPRSDVWKKILSLKRPQELFSSQLS